VAAAVVVGLLRSCAGFGSAANSSTAPRRSLSGECPLRAHRGLVAALMPPASCSTHNKRARSPCRALSSAARPTGWMAAVYAQQIQEGQRIPFTPLSPSATQQAAAAAAAGPATASFSSAAAPAATPAAASTRGSSSNGNGSSAAAAAAPAGVVLPSAAPAPLPACAGPNAAAATSGASSGTADHKEVSGGAGAVCQWVSGGGGGREASASRLATVCGNSIKPQLHAPLSAAALPSLLPSLLCRGSPEGPPRRRRSLALAASRAPCWAAAALGKQWQPPQQQRASCLAGAVPVRAGAGGAFQCVCRGRPPHLRLPAQLPARATTARRLPHQLST
jgi:hypothetical protein